MPPRPGYTVSWLDAPSAPVDDLLNALRTGLTEVPEVTEAWLVRQLVTREGGEPDERACLALASDAWGEERPEPAVVQKLISRVADQPVARDLGVRAWILVNERIRAKMEAQGLKVYERPGAH